jgi:hypothetical protein
MVDDNDTFEGETDDEAEEESARNFVSDEERELEAREADAREADDSGVDISAASLDPALLEGTSPDATEQASAVPPAEASSISLKAKHRAEKLMARPAPAMPDAQTSWADVMDQSAKRDEKKPPRARKVTIAGEERVLKPGEQQVTRLVDVPLSDAESAVRGRQAAALRREIALMDEQRKAANASARGRIAEKQQEIARIDAENESGKQTIETECVELRDERLHVVRTLRLDTGEVVHERAMTVQERQELLPLGEALVDEQDAPAVTAEGAGVVADAPVKAKRTRRTKAQMEAERAAANGAAVAG